MKKQIKKSLLKKRKNLADKYDDLIACLTIADGLAEKLVSEKISEKVRAALRQTIEEYYWLINIIYKK